MSDEGSYALLKLLTPKQQDAVGYAALGGNTGANLAPYILGLFFDCLLFGVLIMQINQWRTYCYSKERPTTKLLVLYVFMVNAGITIFLVVWNMQMFSQNFGRYRQFITFEFASYHYVSDVLIRVPVSSFFAERAWRAAGKKLFLAAVLAALILASLGAGIALKVLANTIYQTSKFRMLNGIWLACHLACGLVTSSVIAWSLYKSRTGRSGEEAMPIQLLVLSADTLLPTTIISLAFLVTFVCSTSSAWQGFFVFSAKVFAICLIAVLNTKFTLRRGLEAASPGGESNLYALKSRSKQVPIQVYVATETYREGGEVHMYDDFEDSDRCQRKESGLDIEHAQDGNYRKTADVDGLGVPTVRFSQ